MKMNPLPRLLTTAVAAAAAVLLTGCFDTKDELTLNPDGSGKAVHESSFQPIMSLNGENDVTDAALKMAIAQLIENSKGVEAWRDVSFKRLDDGRIYFKGTAYFKDLSQFQPDQSIIEFDWKTTSGGGVLTLRTNKNDSNNRKDGFHVEKKPVDYSKLSPEERAQKLKEERANFQRMKPMLSGILGMMKQDVVFHLPGKVAESSSFTTEPNGALRLQFDGAKLVEAMDKILNDDAWCMKNLGKMSSPEKPEMDDETSALVFGSKGPVRASVSGNKAAFDYAAEVAAAKSEFARIKKQLGASPVEVAAPAQGGALKCIRVVGIRLVTETDKQREIRPFNYDAGYTLALLAEFPGSILGVTDDSGLDSAIADDGSNLLPNSEYKQRFHFPRLTKDKTGTILEAELLAPGPSVKGLRELSGHLKYNVAVASKEMDLGITEMKSGAQGTELGAQIKSISDGWKKGSQKMELKLGISKDNLKAVYLMADGSRTELKQTGYSGGGNSYTFTYESTGLFPANGKLVVEYYAELQAFTVPFKLENITLLGTPMGAAK
jgi:hypothetical protein